MPGILNESAATRARLIVPVASIMAEPEGNPISAISTEVGGAEVGAACWPHPATPKALTETTRPLKIRDLNLIEAVRFLSVITYH